MDLSDHFSGCGALACADRFNLAKLWGILVLAGLGIGGIVVPAVRIKFISFYAPFSAYSVR
jgi:hypothetical protein